MNYTKNAIMNAFWQLLEEKPYGKITVKDIVDRCQINRNTFYYHFHDIPELLETIIKTDADNIIQAHSKFGAPMDCIVPLVESCITHQKAILHIYHSIHREIFLRELDRISFYVVDQYFDTVTADLTLLPDDKKLLIRFYKCILTGIVLDWLNDEMKYDLYQPFARICELFHGSSKNAFLKCTVDKKQEENYLY